MKLILSVSEAVLCRWEETSLARKWRNQQLSTKKTNNGDPGLTIGHNAGEVRDTEEQLLSERAIALCLGRIHIIQPRDFTYLSLVAAIEIETRDWMMTEFRLSVTKLCQPIINSLQLC